MESALHCLILSIWFFLELSAFRCSPPNGASYLRLASFILYRAEPEVGLPCHRGRASLVNLPHSIQFVKPHAHLLQSDSAPLGSVYE